MKILFYLLVALRSNTNKGGNASTYDVKTCLVYKLVTTPTSCKVVVLLVGAAPLKHQQGRE
jgi:hypothetical protein